MQDNQEYLNKDEVAKLLGVKSRTISSYCARGILPFFRIGGRLIRFRKSDIDEHLDEHCKVESV